MNSHQIRAALELSRSHSFSRAAERLYVSQPALSYQIRKLEQEVGFAIFNRTPTGVEATEAGRQLLSVLRSSVERVDRAVALSREIAKDKREVIRIGIPNRHVLPVLPYAVPLLEAMNPNVLVEPRFGESGSLDAFVTNELDAICLLEETACGYEDIVAHRLFMSGVYVVVCKDDPLVQKPFVTLDDLYGYTLLRSGCAESLSKLEERVAEQGGLEAKRTEVFDNALTEIAMGGCFALEPGFMNSHSGEFAWIPFEEQVPLSCCVCTHANERRIAVPQLVECLREAYAAHPEFMC